jgi:hypothetical protein
MQFWIKRVAFILATGVFFALLLSGIAAGRSFTLETLLPALARAAGGAALFWLIGAVVADIAIKGIVADMVTGTEDMIEGGLAQRIYSVKERAVPGGPDLPFEKDRHAGKKKTDGVKK